MSRKLVLAMTLTFVLMGMLSVALKVETVEAGGTIYIKADGSIEPLTANITTADNVTYTFTDNNYDSIVVERDNIVVDGAGYTLQGTGIGRGITLTGRSNVTIKNMKIKAFYCGIWLNMSSINSIYGNNITVNGWGYGIELQTSTFNKIEYNGISGQGDGILIDYNSWCNTIRKNTISVVSEGIYISESRANIISENMIERCYKGISLARSCNNLLVGNVISNCSEYGLVIDSGNTCYHNCFINNGWESFNQQIYRQCGPNTWDNGIEGNYWSDYIGQDLNHDGIGDTYLPWQGVDNYPLMGVFSSFNTSLGYQVNVISNSTIEDFTFFESNSTIKMYVSNMTTSQTFGFCRVCIPKDIMAPPYTVIIDDGLTEVLYFNDTVYDNGTHRCIYFAYEHSAHKVEIIPEFPTCALMLLILTLLTVTIAIYKRGLPKTPIY